MSRDHADALRRLPKVDRLARSLGDDVPQRIAMAAARQIVAEARALILAGDPPPDSLDQLARDRAVALRKGRLVPVINATGIVIHTNLGRAPWSASAITAAARAASYCDLEVQMSTGTRGGRLRGVAGQLQELTGAEAAVVVNNCAAAVMLALTAVARDREVVVSRGELVEIGGSFRVPDVIASGGARLREVGTTNRTRAADYAAAIGPETGALLRVHPSNFRVVGFTEEPDRHELVALGRAHGVLVIEDVGAGSLDGGFGETSIREVVDAGVDLVSFSGDKLLGGPQAGIVVGTTAAVAQLRTHPLYRALRVGKVTLAALEATLGDHLAGVAPPVLAMLSADADTLRDRAEALARHLTAAGVGCTVHPEQSFVGGGALPGQGLDTWVVRIPLTDAQAMAQRLRVGEPAVLARVSRGAMHLDPRTVTDEQTAELVDRVADVLGR